MVAGFWHVRHVGRVTTAAALTRMRRMPIRRLLAASALAGAASILIHAQAPQPPGSGAPATPPVPPMIKGELIEKVSPHVWVIPDQSVPLVPNVGIVVGDTATLVIDTGLMHDYRSYPPLAHTDGDLQIRETDEDGVLQQYVGHGTFIAGLVAAVAPNTDVTVRNTLDDCGAVLEDEFGEKLFDAVEQGGWPDILSLSAGTSNGRVDGLLGLDAFLRALRAERTLLVAAAG